MAATSWVSTKWGGPGFVGCVGISGVNVFCVAGAACDGEVDCPSGSDEDTPGYTLACTNNSWATGLLCDKIAQCSDGSDKNLIHCGVVCFDEGTSGLTYAAGAHGDGIADCRDGSDEAITCDTPSVLRGDGVYWAGTACTLVDRVSRRE